MLFSHVKISSFRAKAYLVFHWCLYNNLFYYMATVVHARTLIGCFLVMTRHYKLGVQGIYNLCLNLIADILMNIHVMLNWQLSKKASADQCHLAVLRAQFIVQLIEVTCFFQVICWPVVGFNWLQAQVHNEKVIIIINNLLTSSIRSLQGNLRPHPWCIDRAIHQGLSLRFPCNDLTLG